MLTDEHSKVSIPKRESLPIAIVLPDRARSY
jgi:hypothetical protein